MRKYLISLTILLFGFLAKGQRTYDTLITGASGTAYFAKITEPAWYAHRSAGDSGQVIMFFCGAGEAGVYINMAKSDSLVSVYGPHNRIRAGKWDGGVTFPSGVTHYPFIVSFQQGETFQRPADLKPKFDAIMALYPILRGPGKLSVHMTGPSAGGYASNEFVSYQAVLGDTSYSKLVKTIANIQGVKPDDNYDGTPGYPGKFNAWARAGGKEWGFEQSNDFRDIQTIVNTMNAITANSAVYQQTTYSGGFHCCFNQWYGDSTGTVPAVYSFNGKNLNIYQFMLMYGDTVDDLHTGTHTPPVCTASPNSINIQLPATGVTLNGTAVATNGASIATTVWSLVVNPSGATITSPNSLTTTVTGLSIWSNTVARLLVTDNNGLKDTAYVMIKNDPICNNLSPVRYNLTASGGEIFIPNARSMPWKGKDTLCLPAGNLTDVIFGGNNTPQDGLSGDPCNPIIIMGPDAGVCNITTFRFDDHCQYIRIIDNPRNPLTGILHTIRIAVGGMALVNNFYYSGVYINGEPVTGQGNTGIICKRHIDTLSDGSIVPETIMGNYLMNNITFTNIEIDSTDGEAMYIGPTAPNGGDGQGPVGFYPVRMRKVAIFNVIVKHSGWDGIQLSGGTDSCTIHDNSVYDYGWQNVGSQRAGIIFGGTCGALRNQAVYNNRVIKGTGNGLEIFGYGILDVFNNYLDTCGTSGEQTIFQNDIPSIVTVYGQQKVYYFNNTIRNPNSSGAIVSNNDRGTSLPDSIYSNNFCIPGANSGTWQALYIKVNPAATIINNTFSNTCGSQNVPPTVIAGPSQSLTLPTNNTSLFGTVISPNTIVSNVWSQLAGPSTATIGSPTALNTTITNLIQGVYTFTLTATDNLGNIGSNNVVISVLPASTYFLQFGIPTRWK